VSRALAPLIYILGGLLGLVAFTYPLFSPAVQQWLAVADPGRDAVAPTSTPLLALTLLFLALAVLLLEVHGQGINAKVVAALGVLVAAASVLRFLETAIPGPAGFSPIFVPIILAGYVFGARFGFLMGVMTLLTSGLVTGGIGPWLPYQMFAAGWVGMSAGWLPKPKDKRIELAMLTTFSFAWGVLFGVILNLYFWPFIAGDGATNWELGLGIGDSFRRYAGFYVTTSLVWDLARGFGNAILVIAVGIPAVKAMARFRSRLRFELV
jgi:energy-coupling factor transport system substrate-specific component